MLEFEIMLEAVALIIILILPIAEIFIGLLMLFGKYPKFVSISFLVEFYELVTMK